MSKKWLVTGSGGQLGQVLRSMVPEVDFYFASKSDLDILDLSKVNYYAKDAIGILNLAAITDVDWCEQNQSEAFDVNYRGVINLATSASKYKIPLIQISSDFVFSGKVNHVFHEKGIPSPINYYGQTKAQIEQYLLSSSTLNTSIVRTGTLYSPFGQNMLTWVLNAIECKQEDIKAVDDWHTLSCSAYSLSNCLIKITRMLDSGLPLKPIYHCFDQGVCSKYEWVSYLLAYYQEVTGIGVPEVTPIKLAQLNLNAQRPAYLRLGIEASQKALATRFPRWQQALRHALIQYLDMQSDQTLYLKTASSK